MLRNIVCIGNIAMEIAEIKIWGIRAVGWGWAVGVGGWAVGLWGWAVGYAGGWGWGLLNGKAPLGKRGFYLIVGLGLYLVAAKIMLISTTKMHNTAAVISGAFNIVWLKVVGNIRFYLCLGWGCGGLGFTPAPQRFYMVLIVGGAGALSHCPVAIACNPAGVANQAFITRWRFGK
jgi:hypothetical protein